MLNCVLRENMHICPPLEWTVCEDIDCSACAEMPPELVTHAHIRVP